jgi:hypothetical protein
MEIKIDEPFKGSKSHPIYFGEKSRIPSHTDVKFLSKTRLVIAHRFSGKLFLVDIQNEKYKIVHSCNIMYKGKLDFPDLMDVYENKVYVVNLNSLLHIFEIKYDMIRYVKTVTLDTNFEYHGLHVYESKVFAVTTTSMNKSPFIITEYNLITEKKRNISIQGNTNRMKDIVFLAKNMAVILTNFNNREKGLGKLKEIYDSEIVLCSFDGNQFTVVDTKPFEGCHIDSLAVKGNAVYCTCVFDMEGSFVLKGVIEENRFVSISKIPSPPFTHGIDIFEEQIALASYGTHSTFVQPLVFFEAKEENGPC